MFRRIASVLSGLALLAAVGCASSFADPTGHKTSLQNAQREYTRLVRWGEIKRAAEFVEPELRDEFLSYASDFESIRITDADYDPMGVSPADAQSAAVEVTYHAYSLTTLQEKKIVEVQEWTRHDGLQNTWLVRPQLAAIVEALGVRHVN